MAMRRGWTEAEADRTRPPFLPPLSRKPELVSVAKIWGQGNHNAFTDILRHGDYFYVTFREAEDHVGSDGAIRVIRSKDGAAWESCGLITEESIDLRDPKISVTPDKRLMIIMGGSDYESKASSSNGSRGWLFRPTAPNGPRRKQYAAPATGCGASRGAMVLRGACRITMWSGEDEPAQSPALYKRGRGQLAYPHDARYHGESLRGDGAVSARRYHDAAGAARGSGPGRLYRHEPAALHRLGMEQLRASASAVPTSSDCRMGPCGRDSGTMSGRPPPCSRR